ncbi:10993_t:CDS:2, partial [Diversispora eburnea]
MVKCMRSDAVPLSSEDYKFIIQYRDAKSKTEDLSIPELHLPNIDQASVAENSNGQTSVFETVSGRATIGSEDGMYAIIEYERREAEEAE